MTIRTRGLIIRETDVSDYDKMMTVLTAEHGKISVFGRGVKRYTSPYFHAAQLFCYSDFLLFARKQYYVHVAPPFQFARLAVLKCSSHDSYLFVIIFNSGAKLRHFTEKGKKSPAKNDRLPAATRSQGSLPTKTGAHARPDRTRMQPRIGPASPAARRRMSGKRPSGVTSIAARRPARASTPRPRRAGKAARCPTRKASAAGRCPLPIRARLFVQTTVD